MPRDCPWGWIPAALAVACVVFLSLELMAHDRLARPVAPPPPPKPFVPPPAWTHWYAAPVEMPSPPMGTPAPLAMPALPPITER